MAVAVGVSTETVAVAVSVGVGVSPAFGVSVGDFDSPDPALEKFDIIVATSEKADSLLRHRSSWLQKISLVVADEVHLIHDPERGPTLEITLTKFRKFNPELQVIYKDAQFRGDSQVIKGEVAEPTDLSSFRVFASSVCHRSISDLCMDTDFTSAARSFGVSFASSSSVKSVSVDSVVTVG